MTEQDKGDAVEDAALVCGQAAIFCQLAGERGQPMIDRLLEASRTLEALLAENRALAARVEEAYREGWESGYATGDAGGRSRAVDDDWLGSNARQALSPQRGQ